jgi:hypothetical protein
MKSNIGAAFRTKMLVFTTLSIAVFTGVGRASDAKLDFSGSYTLTGGKGAFNMKKGSTWLLQVVQSDGAITVTKTIDGKATTNQFKLDGTEAPYTSSGGVKGTCLARFKGKTLVLDFRAITRPQPNGPDVQIHTKEQWTLSPNLKTLTVRSDVDFPNSGLGGFQVIEPWSEIYTRNLP